MNPRRLLVVFIPIMYLASILVLGTASLFLQEGAVLALAGSFLTAMVVIGTYIAYKWVGHGFFRRAIVLYIGYLAFSSLVTPVLAESDPFYPFVGPEVTGALSQSTSTVPSTSHSTWPPYFQTCRLTAGQTATSHGSGYYLVSYGKAHSKSDARCNGVGYMQLGTYASGVAASAIAGASVWFIDRNLVTAPPGKNYSLLTVGLHLSLFGWQFAEKEEPGTRDTTVTLDYAMIIVRDDGYQQARFTRFFQDVTSFGGEYDPSYPNILLDPGHSYSVEVTFNATSLSTVVGPAGIASANSCYGYDSSCGKVPYGYEPGYCPILSPSYENKCSFIQWEYTDFGVTNA